MVYPLFNRNKVKIFELFACIYCIMEYAVAVELPIMRYEKSIIFCSAVLL